MADADWVARGIAIAGLGLSGLKFALDWRKHKEDIGGGATGWLTVVNSDKLVEPVLACYITLNCRSPLAVVGLKLCWGQKSKHNLSCICFDHIGGGKLGLALDIENPVGQFYAEPHSIAQLDEALKHKDLRLSVTRTPGVNARWEPIKRRKVRDTVQEWRIVLTEYCRNHHIPADQPYTAGWAKADTPT